MPLPGGRHAERASAGVRAASDVLSNGVEWPRRIVPMLLTPAPLPKDDAAHAYEIKFDGFRGIVRIDHGAVRITSRNLKDLTRYFPELQALAGTLGGRRAILDGEIVALDAEGKPDFEGLHARLTVGRSASALVPPIAFFAFDVLYLDDTCTMDRPYEDRRALLAGLELAGPHWSVPGFQIGGGAELLEASRRMGLEGLVAKRLGTPYLPGVRDRSWLKVKNWRTHNFVIGGWLEHPEGAGGWLGGVLLGYYDAEGQLTCAGAVEAGFNPRAVAALEKILPRAARTTCPFTRRAPSKRARARWLEPRLVCEVRFVSWTGAGGLRSPMFRGFVFDVDPISVVREDL